MIWRAQSSYLALGINEFFMIWRAQSSYLALGNLGEHFIKKS
jgi:hypothetical protein